MRQATGSEVDGLVKFLGGCGVQVKVVVEPFVEGDDLIAVLDGVKFTVPLVDVARGAPLPSPEVEPEPSAVENEVDPVEE